MRTRAAAGVGDVRDAVPVGERTAQQVLRVVEAQLVAAAVLRGGALDIGDPLAVMLGVGGEPARDPLRLDRLGVVEEPVELPLGRPG